MSGIKTIVTNRKARHDYTLEERFEAGMVLQGSEVKSLRAGKANLQDAYAVVLNDGVDLVGLHVAPYEMGGYANHEPTRNRRLLLNKREIDKLRKATEQKGATLIPTHLYFKDGRAKVEIAIAHGKKQYDKRQSIAERETKRRLDRIVRR